MDFQVGANAYLYGTRFVNYLTKTYGYDKLISFYNRTGDSRTFFGSQFKRVYGEPLRKVWNAWKLDEQRHQQENLGAIRLYPITRTTRLTDKPLGSVSPIVYDSITGKAYTAINMPGKLAHLAEIDVKTGCRRKLHNLNGPALYNPAYVALDTRNGCLIYTTNNGKWRGLEVYDNAHDCLYGLFSNAGTQTIVRMDRNLENTEVIYAFPFGVSVFDLAGHLPSHGISDMARQQSGPVPVLVRRPLSHRQLVLHRRVEPVAD